jgi:protein-L-isoaspartate(D-aspartate) O-methyltransferase
MKAVCVRFVSVCSTRHRECGGLKPRLERAVGVIYRAQTELASHYFQAILPDQFDEYLWYIWFNEGKAITTFDANVLEEMPARIPFGL